ncbi:hypothetical protein L1987_14740 [Smallanthus sonchifolius]|uniref:Uncharacterized protein n=1 Tax=Smallanthus sonchifolius TaxID=185202 RepID=A0ACB9J5W4_9ASTR|nr:hypothetical protein L1987_14740 [Smallanthus sonchifolius]
MGTGENNNKETPNNGIKGNVFLFESGKNKNSGAQEKHNDPSINSVAQRIILSDWLKSRKRAIVEKSNDDPFQIDDIINGSGKIETDARKIILKQKIPDLNSSMGASPVEDMEIQTENDSKEIHGGHEENEELDEEIKATIEIGQMLGVDLRSKYELVRIVIQGEENRKGLL